MRPVILLVCVVSGFVRRVSLTPLPNCTRATWKGSRKKCNAAVMTCSRIAPPKHGRRLSIQVAVLPALRRVVEPDPLFIFAGGPGQGARGLAEAAARFFKRVRRSRDIVLVDLRGTGGSAPLRCPEGADDLAELTLEAMTRADT